MSNKPKTQNLYKTQKRHETPAEPTLQTMNVAFADHECRTEHELNKTEIQS